MEIIVFEKSAYYKMLDEVKKSMLEAIGDLRTNISKDTKAKTEEWVTTKEAQKILKCKYLKLRKLRDKPGSVIVYHQDGRYVVYNEASLYKHLNTKAT